MDDGRVTALTLLDLFAAFDTIDHTILLRRLGNWFGVSGKALDWFKSYLTGRSQRIKLGNCLSSKSDLSFGIPQGSVLGPLLFTLYTTPLSSPVSGHAIPDHLYADDSQLYVSFSSGDSAAALNGLQSCLASVQSWMSTNKLKLNPDKTEFLLIGNERQRSKYLSMFPIELLGVETYPAKSARNLGVIFDKNFNFRSHISTICSSCIYHIRDLRRIRRHLDLDRAKLLANALVSSRFDYCNSLLSGIVETDLTKLQRVLNRLARMVTKSPAFTRSVPLLRSLHWLPVKYRVHFKICLLTYKALHEEQPIYLRSLIAISLPSRSLRSTEGSPCPSLGSRPTLAQGPSAHVPLLFGTNFRYLSIQPPRLPPSEDVSKHTFSTWPSPRRHRCAQLPVDVTERFQLLRIWTQIWLLRHWAWLCRRYWRYRNLIDWLIEIDISERDVNICVWWARPRYDQHRLVTMLENAWLQKGTFRYIVCTSPQGIENWRWRPADGFAAQTQFGCLGQLKIAYFSGHLKMNPWFWQSISVIRVAQDRERWRSMTADLLTTDGT